MLVNASEIISQSFLICKKNWRELLIYSIFLFLPSAILVILGILGTYLIIYSPSLSLIVNVLIIAIYAAGLIFTLWATISLSLKIKNLLENKPGEKWQSIFSSTSPMIWPVFYTGLLVGLIIFAGFLLLIIPGIIFAVWYIFFFYFVVFEKKKGLSALRESKKLVMGRWGITLWLVLLPALFYGILAMLLQYSITIPLNILITNDITALITNSVVNSLINSLMAPFTLAAMIVLYLNFKNNPLQTPPPIIEKKQ